MTTGRVAIFIDGKNFYEGLRASGRDHKIDFIALSKRIVKAVDGNVLTGLHYYTGIEPQDRGSSSNENDERPSNGLLNFLSFLETQPGCFVYRFPRRIRRVVCNHCNQEHEYTEEKAVDTSLVATTIRQAAINAFDVAVLCSGDADHTPALKALRDLGKPAWVATFGGHGLSHRLRQAAYGHIDLSTIQDKYSADEVDVEENTADFDVVGALNDAQEYFGSDRYVGFNMFCRDWRSSKLPNTSNYRLRQDMIQYALEVGEIEKYSADDGHAAIRVVGGEEEFVEEEVVTSEVEAEA